MSTTNPFKNKRRRKRTKSNPYPYAIHQEGKRKKKKKSMERNKEEKVKNEIPQGSQGKPYQEVAFFATWSFRFQGSEAILLSLLNYQFKKK